MNEQQRLFLTMTLCMGIFFGWQYLTGGFEPPPEAAQAAMADSAEGGRRLPPGAIGRDLPPGSVPRAAAALATTLSPDGAHAAVSADSGAAAKARHAFRTPLLMGEVQDGDAALPQLLLPAFAPKVLDEDPNEVGRGLALSPQAPGSLASFEQAAMHIRLASGPVALHFVDADRLTLEGAAVDGSRVRVSLLPQEDVYAIDYTVEITNGAAQAQPVGANITLGLAPLPTQADVPADGPPQGFRRYLPRILGGGESVVATDRLRGLLATGHKLTRVAYAQAKPQRFASAQPVEWAALDEQYFLLAWMPAPNSPPARATLFTNKNAMGLEIAYDGIELAPQQTWTGQFRLFAGPKRDVELGAVDSRLVESIDYTFIGVPLGFMARPMLWTLRNFHGLTHSWGLSILLLTLVVKMLLLPVVYKSVTSMRRMQEVKPELDRIKERFADDRERLQSEQLKLFKEHGVNPVSGCLPLLLQMPVWLTLYRTLWGAVDLYRQPFLWLHDLTAPEAFPYLAFLVGGVTWLQQKTTPVAMEGQQARVMMVMMPALVTVFMFNMPSGLVLYILANSVLTIVQQLVIHRRAGTPKKA